MTFSDYTVGALEISSFAGLQFTALRGGCLSGDDRLRVLNQRGNKSVFIDLYLQNNRDN